MTDIPADLRYSADHLWARVEPDTAAARVAVTDSHGDVVDRTLPVPGETVTAGKSCGDIESVKGRNDLVAPATGTVRFRNEALTDTPELVNSDPYGEGWLFEAELEPVTVANQLAALLAADTYRDLAGA